LRGEIAIDLRLTEATRVVWLNAQGLTIHRASLESAAQKMPVEVVPGGSGVLGFALATPAQAGPARLALEYSGAISAQDDHGVFVEQEGGASYVFTQLEPMEARRVFPCVDDPGVKVPWQLSLRVRKTDVALSNTPVQSESREDGDMKVVHFSPTRPLPSYLVAFAVGPFQLVDAGAAGKNKTPVRIAVPRGFAGKAGYAAKTTPPLLGMLEDEIGIPYPYEKLDIVAIPALASFGGMEHPGLVTYASHAALAAPTEETLAFRRDFATTMAHELSHQWFGNLVTMDFWNDLWLNEAFATWMGSKIVARFAPDWHEDARRAVEDTRVMSRDGRVSERKIRQEIRSEDDIADAFDDITYAKGASVLGMFEAYVGPEKFRRGVRRYLERHAHANAISADFLAALSAETAPEVGPALSTFLDQPGVPAVRGELRCEKDKAPTVRLWQSRWLPEGSSGAPAGIWQIPVCLRHGGGDAEGRVCTLLTGPTAEVALPAAKSCPAWVALKEGGRGYFRADQGRDALLALLRKHRSALTLPERLALLGDAEALVESGALALADLLAVAPDIAASPEPTLQRSAVRLVAKVREVHLPPELRPRFGRFIVRTFGGRARALGVTPKAGEDEETALLRAPLASLVADRGGDPATLAALRALATRWLGDPSAAPFDMAAKALAITARHTGDRAFFDHLRAALEKETDPRRRSALLDALTCFRDPAIVDDALALTLSGDLDPREALRMLAQDEPMLERSLAYLEKNWGTLLERMPREALAALPLFFQPFCDEAHRAAVARVFEGRASQIAGGPRALAQSLETIALCDARRRAFEPSLRAFLARY